MSKLRIYTVHRSVHPDGREHWPVNTFNHRAFRTIHGGFPDHKRVRWLVVIDCDTNQLRVIDLWKTTLTAKFPYEREFLLPEVFTDVDHAIGFIVMNFC